MEQKDIVKQLRSEAGMTQKQFADYFGIPYRTLQDWERGVRHMPDYLLRLFVYKMKMEKLTGEHPEWEE